MLDTLVAMEAELHGGAGTCKPESYVGCVHAPVEERMSELVLEC